MALIPARLKIFFRERNWRDALYVVSMVLFFSGAFGLFIWTALFLIRAINATVVKPVALPEDVAAIPSFDVATFAAVAERLGISFKLEAPVPSVLRTPETITSSPVSSPPVTATPTTSPALSSEPLASPTSTPAVVEEISEENRVLPIQVLNGTSVPGLARTWQERLAAHGLTTITIGNADQTTYTGIHVRAKPSARTLVSQLESIIASYDATVTKTEGTAESAAYDITLIIGQ